MIDTEPNWAPDATTIAFASNEDALIRDFRAGFDIYLMERDGSQKVRLTQSLEWGIENVLTGTEARQWNTSPDWSPDGHLIAFRTNRDGNDEIYVMSEHGTILLNLTNSSSSDRDPAWSPDGERIAFVSDRTGNDEVYLMNSDGSGLVRLTWNDTPDSYPCWSPDGTMIAFYSEESQGSNPDVFVMHSDGSGITRLTTHPDFDGYPAWDPRP